MTLAAVLVSSAALVVIIGLTTYAVIKKRRQLQATPLLGVVQPQDLK